MINRCVVNFIFLMYFLLLAEIVDFFFKTHPPAAKRSLVWKHETGFSLFNWNLIFRNAFNFLKTQLQKCFLNLFFLKK